MIIVITHDRTMRRYYGSYLSDQKPNYAYWQRVATLDGNLDQQNATAQLKALLGVLQPGEPLSLVGHGNDYGIGDSPHNPGAWWWSAETLARLFLDHLPKGYLGPVLLESCGESVANLPPRIALLLEGSRFVGMWIHGHQYEVDKEEPLPSERELNGPYYPGAQVT